MLELRNYGELDAFVNALEACGERHFFNVRRDNGEIDEWNASSHQDAEESSNNKFARSCQEDFLAEDELCEEDAEILVMGYDDEEEEVILAELSIILEYSNDSNNEHFNQGAFL